MSDISQAELIKSGKWEKALFTTYALSLTFFETILVPRLRESNCRQIFVLADSDGYANSLVERRSASVGKEFVLIPIVVKPPGIFHPKITYLWGDQDLLMVGSGNLTFGGHGRNVEVLEILRKDTDSQAFLDFADFLDALRTHDRFLIADDNPVREFAARSKINVNTNDLSPSTKILHSIETPVDEQLVAHFGDVTPVSELLCLSPYHHPQANPVKKLVETLGVGRLIVGMPSKKQETTSFPMHEAEKWGIKISCVAPSVEKPNRTLHAKWLEFRGEQVWSFTGSVNATNQSLSTTQNAELGVLRRLPRATSEYWTDTEAPAYSKNDFSAVSKSHSLPIFAQLAEGGSIIGQVLGASDCRGQWYAQLYESGNEFASGWIEIDEKQAFNWDIGQLVQVIHGNAIQIQLGRDGTVARGWLNVGSMLKLSSRSRAGIRAISRMLRREDSFEDIQAVLDLIAIHSHKILSSPTARIASAAEDQESAPDDIVISARDLAVIDDEGELINKLVDSEARAQSSANVLRLIGQLFRGKRISPDLPAQHPKRKIKGTASAEDEDDESAETERKVAALQLFNEQMSEAFSSAKCSGNGIEAILFVWLHVNMDMLLRDIEEGSIKLISFTARWLNLVANNSQMHDYEDTLSGPVFGIAAVLSQFDDEESDKHLLYKHLGLSLEKLHQSLESYVGNSINKDKAAEDAEAWLQYSSASELVDHHVEKAVALLKLTLEKPTYRSVLYSIVKAKRDHQHYDFPKEIFDERSLALIFSIQRAKELFSVIRIVDRKTVSGCPTCHIALLQDDLSKLLSSRIVKCTNCSTILLALKP